MNPRKPERAQTLILFVFAIVGLVALAALIIDGGSIYLNRREAQTAADAAAMAGAYAKCVAKLGATPIAATAQAYATQNAAALESVAVDESGQVNVQTRVDNPSYFASVLGQQTDAARAQAAAGCYVPGNITNLLPIAWTCRPPVGSGWTNTCDIHSIPWTMMQLLLANVQFGNAGHTLLDPGDGTDYHTYYDGLPSGKKEAYVVMDKSVDVAANCAPPFGTGTVICDLNGDGILDITGDDNRGWLALAGTGSSDLVDLMLNGYPGDVTIPQWFPGKTGADNNVFIQSHALEGKLVLVPVFNALCPSTTETQLPTDCASEYQAGDLIRADSGSGDWYRVAGFAPFVVTCVSKGASEQCPAKTYSNVKDNVSTIEGYFVSGYVVDEPIDPNGFDLGIYVISLTK